MPAEGPGEHGVTRLHSRPACETLTRESSIAGGAPDPMPCVHTPHALHTSKTRSPTGGMPVPPRKLLQP